MRCRKFAAIRKEDDTSKAGRVNKLNEKRRERYSRQDNYLGARQSLGIWRFQCFCIAKHICQPDFNMYLSNVSNV